MVKANGVTLSPELKSGSSALYELSRPLFKDTKLVDAAVQRAAAAAGEASPFPEPAAATPAILASPFAASAHVPRLPHPVRFALRGAGLNRFAEIWARVKDAVQHGEKELLSSLSIFAH